MATLTFTYEAGSSGADEELRLIFDFFERIELEFIDN
jgi:hypothetical protein